MELIALGRPALSGVDFFFLHSSIVNLKCLFRGAAKGSYYSVFRSFHKHQAALKSLKADAQP